MAYKGSGKKAKIQGAGGRKQYDATRALHNLGAPKKEPRKSKTQDSNKVHNTKGKNTHGRRSW